MSAWSAEVVLDVLNEEKTKETEDKVCLLAGTVGLN